MIVQDPKVRIISTKVAKGAGFDILEYGIQRVNYFVTSDVKTSAAENVVGNGHEYVIVVQSVFYAVRRA